MIIIDQTLLSTSEWRGGGRDAYITDRHGRETEEKELVEARDDDGE